MLRRVALASAALVLALGCREEAPRPQGAGPRAGAGAPSATGGGEPAPGGSVAAPDAAVVRIRLTARDRHRYCRTDDCSAAPGVEIRREGAAAPLLLFPGHCPISCDDCRAPSCPPSSCTPMGVAVTRLDLDWDGTYFERGTCGEGVPCVTRRRAEPGRYSADACASVGSRTNDSIGVPVCFESGEKTCVSLPFDHPSAREVTGEL